MSNDDIPDCKDCYPRGTYYLVVIALTAFCFTGFFLFLYAVFNNFLTLEAVIEQVTKSNILLSVISSGVIMGVVIASID